MLPPDVEGFTGREDELAALEAAGAVVAVSGPPGVGKSALAVHWAHRAAARFPDGLLHVDLRRTADPLRLLLGALGVDPVGADHDAQVALYRSRTAARRLLVLLDNAADAGQVLPLLPTGGDSRTLITSRRRLTEIVAGLGARPLEVDFLPPAAATALFRRRLGAADTDPDQVAACGGHPLALAVVASHARRSATLAGEFGRRAALDGVRAVFSSSYEGLDMPSARLFRLLGLVAGRHLAVAAVAALAGRPDHEVRRTLRDLADESLLIEHPGGRYAMHTLIHAYAGELVRETESAADRRAALTRLLDHYTHTAYAADLLLNPARAPIPLPLDAPADGARPEPLNDLKAALGWLGAERDELMAAVRLAKDEGLDQQAWQLTWALDTFLNEQGRWDEEGAAWALAVEAAAALSHRSALAYAHSFRAVADGRRQRFEPARAHLRRALDLVRSAGDTAGEGEALFILSYLSWMQGDREDALTQVRQALALFREVDDPMWAGKAALATGWYLAERGDLPGALPHYTDALALQRRAGDHPNEAVTLDALGWLLVQLGDFEQAHRHLQDGLRLARRMGSPALEAQILSHLGDVQDGHRERGNAEALWRQAYDILADLGHPQAADLRRKLETGPPSGSPGRTLGDHVRQWRLRGAMSQEELATRTGLSVRTIRYLESGRAGTPRPETMRLLAEAFGLDRAAWEELALSTPRQRSTDSPTRGSSAR